MSNVALLRLVAAAIVCVTLSHRTDADDRLSVPSFIDQPSVRSASVEMQIGRTRWEIPRNYILTALIGQSTKEAYFDLVATLPDFSGATKETLNCFHSRNWKHCPQIVSIRTAARSLSVSNWNERVISVAHRRHRREVFGLENFEMPRAEDSQNRALLAPGNYFVYAAQTPEESLVIQCPIFQFLFTCQAYIEFHGLPFRYDFLPERISEWRAIHNGVMALLQRFYVGDTQ